MQQTAGLVVGLTAWAILVSLLLVGERSYCSLAWGVPVNRFAPDGSDVNGFAKRLVRAHVNNYENVAILCVAPDR